MPGSGPSLPLLCDPRIAPHALSVVPVWAWSTDGTHILWTNAPGAAVFYATPASIDGVKFEHSDPLTKQISRIATTLTESNAPRLERIHGFGGGTGGSLTCQCSRVVLAGGIDAILVVSLDRAGTTQPLHDRLTASLAGLKAPLAAFSPAGSLIMALPEAADRLGSAGTLEALGATQLAQAAMRDGRAEGALSSGHASITRLGAAEDTVLLVQFTQARTAETQAHDTPAASPPPPTRSDLLRFIWSSDASGRFRIETDAFLRLTDPRTVALSGKLWSDYADTLALDRDGVIAKALASHQTWSALPVAWPAAGGGELTAELSGLPQYDQARQFQGYRGFGLCRGIAPAAAAQTQAPAPAATKTPQDDAGATVVPFPSPVLTPVEQTAFHELARELGDRLKSSAGKPIMDDDFGPERQETAASSGAGTQHGNAAATAPADASSERPILDRLPVGILVYRYNTLIYANRALLDWTGYRSLEALTAAGGLDSLFIEPAAGAGTAASSPGNGGAKALAIATRDGSQKPVEGRLFSVAWENENALVLMINTLAQPQAETAPAKPRVLEQELAHREVEAENRNLKAALDTATDGVLLLDATGRILFANNSAAALFGHDAEDLTEMMFGDMFAPESRRAAADYLEKLGRDGNAGILNPGREMIAKTLRGELIPLHLTIGRVGSDGEKFCAVLRDITAQKKSEEELLNARHQADASSAAKSEFLAKISHDIRTPLNAIIGFSEVMIDERFGAIGNERYQQYLRDIHTSGEGLVALLNELLDLAKIESGKLDLNLTQISLNDITQQSVAALQPQANRARVIIRSSLPPNLPPIVADARSVRQIVLNLMANSIKFTGAGGQVIVSTALNGNDEVVLRVRDNGAGLSDRELLSALEPFRHISTSARWGISGTGLDLPITKALAEANRATFSISSGADQGTLVEVAFPATRVIA